MVLQQEFKFMLYFYILLTLFFIINNINFPYHNKVYAHNYTWNYEGKEGPAYWAKVGEELTMCVVGRQQSPIEIRDFDVKKNEELPKIEFFYQGVPLKIQNNGKTAQINYPKGSYVKIGEVKSELMQFHFHTPSEHFIGKKSSEMELHLVNKKEDGSLLIIAVLIESGKNNTALKALLKNLPLAKGTEISLPYVTINPIDFLPATTKYYTYKGSLTTPPCLEMVEWYILKEKIEVSYEQVKQFRKLFPINARPTQPLFSRLIEEKN